MLINTKCFEIEFARRSLWLRVTAFGKTCATFRDWSGQGLSATDWMIDAPKPVVWDYEAAEAELDAARAERAVAREGAVEAETVAREAEIEHEVARRLLKAIGVLLPA